MSSRFDDDMQARVVSGPAHYDFAARGPVAAVPVELEGRVVGYLFHGLQGEEGSAGLITASGTDFVPEGSGHWLKALRALKERDVSAADAVASLLGTAGPGQAGHVGPSLQTYDGKHALDQELNPQKAAAQLRGRGTETADVSRQAVDAALRGQMPMTPAVAERVANMDAALQQRPTPEPVLVALTPATSRIPDDLASGARVQEASFLISYLAGTDHPFVGVDTVVWLRVPEGTPALFQEPALPTDPGTLLLGRGLTWEVERVLERDQQRIVTARVIAREPQRVSV